MPADAATKGALIYDEDFSSTATTITATTPTTDTCYMGTSRGGRDEGPEGALIAWVEVEGAAPAVAL